MTILSRALELASEGFHIFPILPNDSKKPPRDFHFKEMATRNIETITHWWTNGYTNYNIGIFAEKHGESEALIVVDIDIKKNKMGENTIRKLKECDGLEFPSTYEVRTPSGGRHLYYRAKFPVKQGTDVLGDGIDIRSSGGYVLGVGSVLSNGKYVGGGKGLEITEAPEWLIEYCGKPSEQEIGYEQRERDFTSSPTDVKRAKDYLINEAPIAIEGKAGDQTTLSVALKCKDFGVTKPECFELMKSNWNSRCIPAWPGLSLFKKVDNAYKYGKNPIGVLSTAKDFKPIIEELLGPTTKKPRFTTKLLHEIEPNLQQTYLVEKLLSLNAMSVIYGESNSGKTFFSLNLALHVSLGVHFHDKEVKPGAVLYVAAEGGFGIKKRISAFKKHHNLEKRKDIPFGLIDVSVDLKKDTIDLLDAIKQVEDKFQTPVVLVVIDTLARTLGDGNENEAKDMGAFIKAADAIRDQSKAHVMVIHHTGKDSAKGARGHSSLRGATDTEILIEEGRASVKKQRDMDYGPDMGFKLHEIEIGVDEKGKSVTSCVVLPANLEATADFKTKELTEGSISDVAYHALVRATANKAVPAPNNLGLAPDMVVVPIDEWREEFFQSKYGNSPKIQSWHVTFGRALKDLTDQGYVTKSGQFVWIN